MIYRFSIANTTNRKSVTVDGSKTIRQVFEENCLEIGNANVSVDGAPYMGDELDTPIDEFNLDPNNVHFVSSVVKRDNAATAVLAGSALVITSALQTEELEAVSEYAEDLAEMKNEDGETEYVIKTGTGDGSISQFGAIFGNRVNEEGHPTITVTAPEHIKNVKEWAMSYGRLIVKLNAAENKIKEHITEVFAKKEEAENAITFA